MASRLHMLIFATLASAALAFAQNPVTMDGPFQVRYASNILNGGDAVVNITNTGASATALLTGQIIPQNNINGSICVNFYSFAADEQEVSCCSCLVTPNGLSSLSARNSLLQSTLTSSVPNELVIKLISTVPNVGSAGAETCNPGAISLTTTIGTTPGSLANGMLAWGTSTHGIPAANGPSFQLSETQFLPATLSAAELARDVQECQFIQILGSGNFGLCKGCANNGLGANAE